MPVSHHVVENEPIVFSVFYDTVDYKEMIEAFDLIDRVLSENGYPMIYWIGDSTAVSASHVIMKRAVEETLSGRNGTGGDSRVIPLMVMQEELYVYFTSEFENRDATIQFPFFRSAPDAYEFVQFLKDKS